jgi:hypothetical protein
MFGMALSPDDSRELLDVLYVLHTDPAFHNLMHRLFFSASCVTPRRRSRSRRRCAPRATPPPPATTTTRRRTTTKAARTLPAVALQADLDAAADDNNEDAPMISTDEWALPLDNNS